MIKAKCIQKLRNKNNQIYKYIIVDSNGNHKDIDAKSLKQAIISNQIEIANLSLTSDGRLIDKGEKARTTDDYVVPKTNTKGAYRKFAEAYVFLTERLMDMGDSYTEILDNAIYASGLKYDAWEIESYIGKPGFKNCTNGNEVQHEMLIKCYEKIASDKPKSMEAELKVFTDPEYEYLETLERDIQYEKSKDISKSETYKAVSTILHYSISKGFSAKIIKNLKKLIATLDKKSFNAVKVGYETGYHYFRYLDSNLFGTISNDCFTVGHSITASDKKEFKEYKPYSYVLHKGFNKLNRPETPICALFKDGENGIIDVDIKLAREGYTSESERCIGVIGYFMNVCTIQLDINDSPDNWGKKLADAFNKIAVKVEELADRYPELRHIHPYGKELKTYNM